MTQNQFTVTIKSAWYPNWSPRLAFSYATELIPINLLRDYHARIVATKQDQILFEEGDPANDFLQVEQGQIKMYILNSEGQEFTQGVRTPIEDRSEILKIKAC